MTENTLTTLRYSAMAVLPVCDNLRAASSHTQQWMPLLPEYTHKMCSKPKSSERRRKKKKKGETNKTIREWLLLISINTAFNSFPMLSLNSVALVPPIIFCAQMLQTLVSAFIPLCFDTNSSALAVLSIFNCNHFLPSISTAVLACWPAAAPRQVQKTNSLNQEGDNLFCTAHNVFKFSKQMKNWIVNLVMLIFCLLVGYFFIDQVTIS